MLSSSSREETRILDQPPDQLSDPTVATYLNPLHADHPPGPAPEHRPSLAPPAPARKSIPRRPSHVNPLRRSSAVDKGERRSSTRFRLPSVNRFRGFSGQQQDSKSVWTYSRDTGLVVQKPVLEAGDIEVALPVLSRNLFYNPLEWPGADRKTMLRAKQAGAVAEVLLVVGAVMFLLIVLIPLGLWNSEEVLQVDDLPTYGDYQEIVAMNATKLRPQCLCSRMNVNASVLGTWSYDLDSVCELNGVRDYEMLLADLRRTAELLNILLPIPPLFTMSLKFISDLCEEAGKLMAVAKEKFRNTVLSFHEVLSERELEVLLRQQLLDYDVVWPTFFGQLQVHMLGLWGSVNRPLITDTLQTLDRYSLGKIPSNYSSCFAFDTSLADPRQGSRGHPVHPGLPAPWNTTSLMGPASNDPFAYHKRLFDDRVVMPDMCGLIPGATTNTGHQHSAEFTGARTYTTSYGVFCDPFATLMRLPVVELAREWVALCAQGPTHFQTWVDAFVPGLGTGAVILTKSQYETIRDMIDGMFIKTPPSSTLQVMHEAHFWACAPSSCTYYVRHRAAPLAVVALVPSLIAGYSVVSITTLRHVGFPFLCLLLGASKTKKVQEILERNDGPISSSTSLVERRNSYLPSVWQRIRKLAISGLLEMQAIFARQICALRGIEYLGDFYIKEEQSFMRTISKKGPRPDQAV